LSTAAAARANLVFNGSFEQPTVGGGFVTLPSGSTGLTGWTILDGTVGLAPDSIDHIGSYWQAAEGNQSIDLDGGASDGNDAAAISQDISTTPGQSYLLQFAMAGNPDNGDVTKTVKVSFGAASDTYTFNTTGMTHENMGWVEYSLLLPGNLVTGNTTTLMFDSRTTGYWGPALDNVRVSAVPLPAAAWGGMALFGLVGGNKLRRLRRATNML
jgi:choice-of-anchor C domain-containing protein